MNGRTVPPSPTQGGRGVARKKGGTAENDDQIFSKEKITKLVSKKVWRRYPNMGARRARPFSLSLFTFLFSLELYSVLYKLGTIRTFLHF